MEETSIPLSFLRDLVHELKDPFAAVYGGLELSSQTALSTAERDRLQQSMVRNSQVMKRVLEDAATYLRVRGGVVAAKADALDVKASVESAVEATRPQLSSRGQSVSVVAPSELWVASDKESLERAVSCLLGALSRVCPHGETLQLEAHEPVGTRMWLTLSTTTPNLRLKEGDFRVQLAEGLAQALGGDVEIRMGESSRLEAVLAIACLPADPGGKAAIAVAKEPRKLKILVVDDNRDGADTSALWLEAHGHDVSVAYDGVVGMEEFRRFRPDVGLFDIGLPRKNGYELAAEIRTSGFRGCLIALTGYGQAKDRNEAIAAGFSHHIVKPVDLGKLSQLLSNLEAIPRILVVEDNPIALKVTVGMLERLGAQTYIAKDAEEGLARIAEERPDLVLCDLGLPGKLDGYDVARRTKADQATSTLPLIALTGDADAYQRARDAGFEDVVEKPVSEATLKALIARYR